MLLKYVYQLILCVPRYLPTMLRLAKCYLKLFYERLQKMSPVMNTVLWANQSALLKLVYKRLLCVAPQTCHKNFTTEIKCCHAFVCKKNQLEGTNMIKGKHGSLAPFRRGLKMWSRWSLHLHKFFYLQQSLWVIMTSFVPTTVTKNTVNKNRYHHFS